MKLLAVTVLGLLALTACRRRQEPLPAYGEIPPFKLTRQDGAAFSSAELKGKIWVADFIFTHCPGPCPRMTSQMRQVQQATYRMPNVRLVSFTVDPARDTPPVLNEYAKIHHASTDRWFFLTGPQALLHRLAREDFKVGNVDGTLQHSTRFMLVDETGQLRGYYDTSEPDSIAKLIAGIHVLARERA